MFSVLLMATGGGAEGRGRRFDDVPNGRRSNERTDDSVEGVNGRAAGSKVGPAVEARVDGRGCVGVCDDEGANGAFGGDMWNGDDGRAVIIRLVVVLRQRRVIAWHLQAQACERLYICAGA